VREQLLVIVRRKDRRDEEMRERMAPYFGVRDLVEDEFLSV